MKTNRDSEHQERMGATVSVFAAGAITVSAGPVIRDILSTSKKRI